MTACTTASNVEESQHCTNTARSATSKCKMSDEKYVIKLRETMYKLRHQNKILKRKLRRRDMKFEKIFNEDQHKFLTSNTQRGASWSSNTMTKALRLYMACGQKGYEEIRRQNLPYPSICTLQYRLQGLKFKPGILDDIFCMLKTKVSTDRNTCMANDIVINILMRCCMNLDRNFKI